MKTLVQALPYIQIIISILLILCILVQQSEAGMGAIGGGSDSTVHRTRRGFEKFVFYLTIILAILFAVSSFVAIIL